MQPEDVQPTATNEKYIIAKACMGLIPKAGELLSVHYITHQGEGRWNLLAKRSGKLLIIISYTTGCNFISLFANHLLLCYIYGLVLMQFVVHLVSFGGQRLRNNNQRFVITIFIHNVYQMANAQF